MYKVYWKIKDITITKYFLFKKQADIYENLLKQSNEIEYIWNLKLCKTIPIFFKCLISKSTIVIDKKRYTLC